MRPAAASRPWARKTSGATVWGTGPLNGTATGTVLARATVKSGVAPNTQLGFFCTVHGRPMSGTLAVGDASTPTQPPDGNPPTQPPAAGGHPPTPPVPGKQLPAPG